MARKKKSEPLPEITPVRMSARREHIGVFFAGFFVLFAMLITVSSGIFAQSVPDDMPGLKVGVSAEVAETPFNTRPLRKKNFFERMDPYQKLTFISSVALGTLSIPTILLFIKSRKRSDKSQLA